MRLGLDTNCFDKAQERKTCQLRQRLSLRSSNVHRVPASEVALTSQRMPGLVRYIRCSQPHSPVVTNTPCFPQPDAVQVDHLGEGITSPWLAGTSPLLPFRSAVSDCRSAGRGFTFSLPPTSIRTPYTNPGWPWSTDWLNLPGAVSPFLPRAFYGGTIFTIILSIYSYMLFILFIAFLNQCPQFCVYRLASAEVQIKTICIQS